MAVKIVLPAFVKEIIDIILLLDNPGTYLMMIVFGMVLVPFYIRSVHYHIKNPQEYHMMSFEKKFWIGFFVITALLVIGAVNFIRFLP